MLIGDQFGDRFPKNINEKFQLLFCLRDWHTRAFKLLCMVQSVGCDCHRICHGF